MFNQFIFSLLLLNLYVSPWTGVYSTKTERAGLEPLCPVYFEEDFVKCMKDLNVKYVQVFNSFYLSQSLDVQSEKHVLLCQNDECDMFATISSTDELKYINHLAYATWDVVALNTVSLTFQNVNQDLELYIAECTNLPVESSCVTVNGIGNWQNIGPSVTIASNPLGIRNIYAVSNIQGVYDRLMIQHFFDWVDSESPNFDDEESILHVVNDFVDMKKDSDRFQDFMTRGFEGLEASNNQNVGVQPEELFKTDQNKLRRAPAAKSDGVNDVFDYHIAIFDERAKIVFLYIQAEIDYSAPFIGTPEVLCIRLFADIHYTSSGIQFSSVSLVDLHLLIHTGDTIDAPLVYLDSVDIVQGTIHVHEATSSRDSSDPLVRAVDYLHIDDLQVIVGESTLTRTALLGEGRRALPSRASLNVKVVASNLLQQPVEIRTPAVAPSVCDVTLEVENTKYYSPLVKSYTTFSNYDVTSTESSSNGCTTPETDIPLLQVNAYKLSGNFDVKQTEDTPWNSCVANYIPIYDIGSVAHEATIHTPSPMSPICYNGDKVAILSTSTVLRAAS